MSRYDRNPFDRCVTRGRAWPRVGRAAANAEGRLTSGHPTRACHDRLDRRARERSPSAELALGIGADRHPAVGQEHPECTPAVLVRALKRFAYLQHAGRSMSIPLRGVRGVLRFARSRSVALCLPGHDHRPDGVPAILDRPFAKNGDYPAINLPGVTEMRPWVV